MYNNHSNQISFSLDRIDYMNQMMSWYFIVSYKQISDV